MKPLIIYEGKPNTSLIESGRWISHGRANIDPISDTYLSANRNIRLKHLQAKGNVKSRICRSLSQIKRRKNEYKQDMSRLINSELEYKQYPIGSVLNKFLEQLAKITEVKRVLYSIEKGDFDIYIIFDSSSLSVRFDIYKQAQVIISQAFAYGINVDLHATNLADFDSNQLNSLIPTNAISILNR